MKEIESLIPDGIVFDGNNPDYEDKCRSFYIILNSLPKIDDWKPKIYLMELNEIAQSRLDAQEIGEIECLIGLEEDLSKPGKQLREYRYKFNTKRKELIREAISELIDSVDQDLKIIGGEIKEDTELNAEIKSTHFDKLRNSISQIDTLLGSSVSRPIRWSDLQRHLHFGEVHDFNDIMKLDWPNIKEDLKKNLYSKYEPIPLEIDDLSEIVNTKPKGPVANRLAWENLSSDEFECLIFTLISSENKYENPEWLMQTNAPDRGRDLSVYRRFSDPLGGIIRQRVIIQCKHWLKRSVSVTDVAELREQMKLWEPPRVDVHIIATTGRFTSDAVALIEKNNQTDTALRIEMWPESHLERLLALRPALIAEFGLR